MAKKAFFLQNTDLGFCPSKDGKGYIADGINISSRLLQCCGRASLFQLLKSFY